MKNRARSLNGNEYQKGEIVYWMQREHRVDDNWAFIIAQELAKKHDTSLKVMFCIRESFEDCTERLIEFMFQGLKEVEEILNHKNIEFNFLLGDPVTEVPKYIKDNNIGGLVTDFNPLRTERKWREKIAKEITIPFCEVDARNIVPCWVASPKQEFAAYTFRSRLQKLLLEYLEEFPEIKKQQKEISKSNTDWQSIYSKMKIDASVKKLEWIQGGEKHALKTFDKFLDTLGNYSTDRNDPSKQAQSELSPYLHFGHISSQRIILDLQNHKGDTESKKAFIEEITVRRELSDNFCFYNTRYDSIKHMPEWAQDTLSKHEKDRKEHIYSRNELEQARTHDELWNAAQMEAVKKGKMHGYMRMYWAKKILEWSISPQYAMNTAIYLMDKYFIDGRETNGFTGIAWSIAGVHDRPWFERSIFGKIRYMNYNGAKKKFDIQEYIHYVDSL